MWDSSNSQPLTAVAKFNITLYLTIAFVLWMAGMLMMITYGVDIVSLWLHIISYVIIIIMVGYCLQFV